MAERETILPARLRSSERIRSSFLVSSVLVPVCVLVTHGACEVNLQSLVDERAALARRRGATQQGIDARHEHTGAIGLGNKVVRAERHGHDLVDLGRARREDDDGDLGFAANLVADMLAVLDGKREVEQHQVGRGGENIARDMLKRFAGLDFKPGAGKDVDKLTTNGLVVLNDIDQRHVSSHFA